MKPVFLAILIAAGTSAAAGVPPFGLPDLTFPAPLPAPDISTQNCGPTVIRACR